MRTNPPSSIQDATRFRFENGKGEKQTDQLAIEEPLEIILEFSKPKTQNGYERLPLAITMRTPGNDNELAAGFLFAENIIRHQHDIASIDMNPESANPHNSILVTLSHQQSFDPQRLQRHFFTNSSCGVCGKTSIQALEMLHRPHLLPDKPSITTKVLQQLPEWLHQHQQQFAVTGGVHAAALFSPEGELLLLREDVGRHNAMDKLIGACLLEDKLSLLKNNLVLVSGRASFELIQKALMADIPFLAAIGAPTSLAVQLADRHHMTLVGFLKADGFNCYSAPARIT